MSGNKAIIEVLENAEKVNAALKKAGMSMEEYMEAVPVFIEMYFGDIEDDEVFEEYIRVLERYIFDAVRVMRKLRKKIEKEMHVKVVLDDRRECKDK